MDFKTAQTTAHNYYATRPFTVPVGQADPNAYRVACEENLAFALCERSQALVKETEMNPAEAGMQAATEITEMAAVLAEPTPAHLAEVIRQREEAEFAAVAAGKDDDTAE